MNKLVIIDGNSLINRAFYALPPLVTKTGKVYNAVFGFINIVVKLITENKPSHLVVAFDYGKKTFRNELYADYKGTRKGMPDELREQLEPLKDLLKKMNIKILEKAGIEADDIIGTLTKRFAYPSVVVTGDRDCLQLIDDTTEVWLTKHGISDIVSMNQRQLKEEMGLTPSQIIDLKSLMGDSSDSIPGVAGIGPKTATDLLNRFQTLDGVYNNLSQITGKVKDKLVMYEDMARLSYKLATIDTNCVIDCSLDECEVKFPFSQEVYNTFLEYEFSSLLKRQDLFSKVQQKEVNKVANISKITSVKQIKISDVISIYQNENQIELAVDDENLYVFEGDLKEIEDILQDEKITKVLHKIKPLLHKTNGNIKKAQSVCLATYLVNSNIKNDDVQQILEFLNISSNASATTLLKAWEILNKELDELNLKDLYTNLEMPLIYILYDMEKQGVCVDENVISELSAKFSAEIVEIKQQIFHLAGEEFNLNSPKQLAEILYTKLGLLEKNNKKQSTAVDKLEAIKDRHPIVDLLLRYRTISKLQSTYIDGLKVFIKDKKIHTTFNQTQTVTGRLSSNEPNLQNIPIRTKEGKVLRRIFTASENSVLISADYSQIELRLLAHYSKDRNLIEAYHQNKDIHTTTASQIFNVPYNEVTKDMRRTAKEVNFGIIYGISPYGLSQGIGVSVGQAKAYIDKYFEMYPTIKDFLNNSVEKAKQQGFVTSLLGRRRNITEIYSTNHNTAMFGERAAMNMPLQGTSADIIKLAMIKVCEEIKKQNLKSKIILQIHDELIFDVPDGEKKVMLNLVKTAMENVLNLDVPLVVDVSMGTNWFDTKQVEF